MNNKGSGLSKAGLNRRIYTWFTEKPLLKDTYMKCSDLLQQETTALPQISLTLTIGFEYLCIDTTSEIRTSPWDG